MMFSILKDQRVLFLMLSMLFSSVGSGISSFGVTWLIISKKNGEEAFGITTLAITIITFLITPYIGIIVDKFSRKSLYLFIQLSGFLTVCLVVLYALFFKHEYNLSILIILQLLSAFYYAFCFPITIAYVQETFDQKQFNKINSMIETISQTAALSAGGLASILLERVSYTSIFLLDAFSFLLAFMLFVPIKYKKTKKITHNTKSSSFRDFKESFRYLKGKKWVFIFLLCVNMPFLVVMILNYLIPIFIQNVLKQESNIYGLSTFLASVGALIGGIVYPKFSSKIGDIWAAILHVVVFTLALILTAAFPFVFPFLMLNIIRGWGHGGSKIARRTIMMNVTSNNMIGRVNSLYTSIQLFIRIIFLATFTFSIKVIGVHSMFWILAVFMLIVFIFLIVSAKKEFLSKNKIIKRSKGEIQNDAN